MKELSAWLANNTPLESQPNQFLELFANERMRLLGLRTMTEYVTRLSCDSNEAMILHQHVSPPETWLFRYLAAFEVLRAALDGCDRNKVIQVASLGCATGSEPFSIAATALSCGYTAQNIRILALDYSENHLQTTRNGVVSPLALRTPIPQWAAPWLHPTNKGQISLDARGLAMLDLVRGDLSIWKPDRKFDFVFCRNVAIYLNATIKKRLGQMLVEMTKPEGIIFLGHADSVILSQTDAKRSDVDHAFAYCKLDSPTKQTSLNDLAPLQVTTLPTTPAFITPTFKSIPAIAMPQKNLAHQVAPPRIELKSNYLQEAQIAADAGALLAAEKALTAHFCVKPEDAQAHALLGCIQMAQNKFTFAERSFTKVVYLEPSHSLALLSLAALAEMRGDAKAAERFRDRAARIDLETRRE